MKRLRIPVLILALGGFLLFSWWMVRSGDTQGTVITLTHLGFEPDYVIIHQGDTVTFKTDRGTPFWPASNFHPLHDQYPEFDPKRAIGPTESWTFTFTREGSFRFHNHIGSSYAPEDGEIVVAARGAVIPTSPELSVDVCLSMEGVDRHFCWERLLRRTLRDQGIRAVLTSIRELYQSVPDFAASCNSFTHRVGGQSYLQYRKNLQDVMIPETLYCGGGFFHGFMEVFITQDRRIDRAKQFCADVAKTMGETYPLTVHACIHGIGHGVMELLGIHTTIDWSVLPALIDQGIAQCETFDEHQRDNCVNGMFNAILMHYEYSQTKPAQYATNPFWFCGSVRERYRKFCYEGMAISSVGIDRSDIVAVAEMFNALVPEQYQTWSLRTVIQDIAFKSVKQPDWNDHIQNCRQLKSSLIGFCLDTFVESLIDNGDPGLEYKNAMRFCGSSVLAAERHHCLSHTLAYMKRIYGTAYPADMCRELPEDLRGEYCR